ncbi:hypothetical protein [Amycolatopsis sp. NPDC049159]|uniref:hypothetical protein n=1 Tax=Amycolatopsis sp. NPDC049159 TaxID=3157210 RepID=UPI0033EEF238
MTVSILASGSTGRDTLFPARPHPRRAAVWTPFESIVWAVSLLCAVRRLGGSRGGHRRAAAGTRLNMAAGRAGKFLRDWWVLFAVFGGFALVTIVGVLVLSVQVPR